MKGCKHLDYEEGKFTDCEIVDLTDRGMPGVRHWKRGETWIDRDANGRPQNPVNVQFCKLRGRINGIFDCYNAGELPCYEIDKEPKP